MLYSINTLRYIIYKLLYSNELEKISKHILCCIYKIINNFIMVPTLLRVRNTLII